MIYVNIPFEMSFTMFKIYKEMGPKYQEAWNPSQVKAIDIFYQNVISELNKF